MILRSVLVCLATFVVACGGNKGNPGGNGDGGGDGDADVIVDGALPQGCSGPVSGVAQCSNCVDDDGDGAIDGFDIQCTGPADNDEATFKTGISGDNIDPKNQDCFFDGNSGAGQDCNIQTCCLLGITDPANCPDRLGGNNYKPAECPPPIGTKPLEQKCIENCARLTPAGCDCFGCCTLCNPDNPTECYDILTNPAVSPDCTIDVLSDPTKCLRCTPSTECGGGDCGGGTCILCPGQDPNDLPPGCDGTSECPNGQASCQNMPCPAQTFCDNTCCVPIVL